MKILILAVLMLIPTVISSAHETKSVERICDYEAGVICYINPETGNVACVNHKLTQQHFGAVCKPTEKQV